VISIVRRAQEHTPVSLGGSPHPRSCAILLLAMARRFFNRQVPACSDSQAGALSLREVTSVVIGDWACKSPKRKSRAERDPIKVEIERKFLVRGSAWRSLATSEARIRQAYLASGERSTTRVRIKNDVDAFLTSKSKPTGLLRLEIECPISLLDADTLLILGG
jgi:hypothetical protein